MYKGVYALDLMRRFLACLSGAPQALSVREAEVVMARCRLRAVPPAAALALDRSVDSWRYRRFCLGRRGSVHPPSRQFFNLRSEAWDRAHRVLHEAR